MKKMLFILLLLVLLLSATGLRAVPHGDATHDTGMAVPQGDGRDRPADRIDDIENEVRLLLERVSPSLVKVVAENGRKYVATGIALEGGMVITSTEVLRRPFARLSVETTKGESIAARLAGQDKRSGLALLRLDKKALTPLAPAKPGEVGNWVALVGLFYDRFPAIFQGIISSAGDNELILNAPIAPGAAGGAVVNKKGELQGIIRGSVGFTKAPDLTFKDH
jgi:S1-C subfamily serine protease